MHELSEITLEECQKVRLVYYAHNSKKLYLGAQMELEGVLGLVDMLRELVRPMRVFLGSAALHTDISGKKYLFSSKYTAEGYELFDIPL